MATRIVKTDPAVHRLAGMAADLYGEDDGRPALVLLHGLTYDRRIWQPILDRLFTIDPLRQILAIDLPGHGESPDQFPHTIERVASLIHDAIDEAGLEAPVLVGHSISGGIASVYAGRYPSSGVVNVDAAPDLASPARMLQSAVARMGQADFMALWAMMEPTLHTELLPTAARQMVTSNSRPRPATISYWANLLEETPEALTNWVHAEMAAVAINRVPYLLVAGSELPAPLRKSMVRAIPHATIEVWAGSGHFPHLAHPDRFVDWLTATGQWRAGSGSWHSATAAGIAPVEMERVIEAHFAAEASGDIEAILDTLTEDIDHETLGAGIGSLKGKEAVRAFYTRLSDDLSVDTYTTTRRIVGSDYAWEEGIVKAMAIGSPFGQTGGGRAIAYRLNHFFEFRDGLISRELAFVDASSIVNQLREVSPSRQALSDATVARNRTDRGVVANGIG